MTLHQQRREKSIAVLIIVAIAAAAVLLVTIRNNYDSATAPTSQKQTRGRRRETGDRSYRRRLKISRTKARGQGTTALAQFSDPKSVVLRTGSPLEREAQWQHQPLGQIMNPSAFILPPQSALRPYSIENVLLTLPYFTKQFFVFMYVSATDEFVALYNKKHAWSTGCNRILMCGTATIVAFRRHFPERFQGVKGGSRDLVMLASVGDSPKMKQKCTVVRPEGKRRACGSDDFAGILGFGSVFTDPQVLPNLVTMPMMPKPHIPCFMSWQMDGEVCKWLLPRFRVLLSGVGPKVDHLEGLVYGEDVGLAWEDLIPSVVWRGTDFGFLMQLYPDLNRPDYDKDVAPKLPKRGATPGDVVRALLESWDTYLPRWKGAILTAEAELEAEAKNATISSFDIKFSHFIQDQKKTLTNCSDYFRQWDKMGVHVHTGGKSMDMVEHARYKYHIDLGGGGGTTWTGTILKLSLPGLLFHHVTPTKDWILDHILPWVHYVPVSTDLSDLKEKFLWAESHPDEAKKIADTATEFMRFLGTKKGFSQVYEKYFVENLGRIIDAYQPVEETEGGDARAMAKLQTEQPDLEQVMRCPVKHECEMYRGRKAKHTKIKNQ